MSTERRHHREVVVGFLRQNLGSEKATALVDDACGALGYPGELSREQCLSVLEQIASEPGIVGITARFAKSRAIFALGTE